MKNHLFSEMLSENNKIEQNSVKSVSQNAFFSEQFENACDMSCDMSCDIKNPVKSVLSSNCDTTCDMDCDTVATLRHYDRLYKSRSRCRDDLSVIFCLFFLSLNYE